MSNLKFVCVAVVTLGAFAASSALADCTKSQEVALATQATRAVTAELGGSLRQKVMRIHDCEASEDGVIKADFVFDYVDDQGVQSVSGRVQSDGQRITALNLAGRQRRVALEDSYSETSYGAYKY
ncbi:MAG TPA: hypothetical protein VG839_05890 [Asticcacaulis sp.]|nr:hypothetical protein [Asticcacaulis sp.]